MISEQELAKLSCPGAPELITKIPGPKAMKVLADVPKYESLTRPGSANPPVWDEGLGATIKDSDGNLFIDLTAGVAVSADWADTCGECMASIGRTKHFRSCSAGT